MTSITNFLSCYSTKYKKKIIYFFHANLGKIVYKTVT